MKKLSLFLMVVACCSLVRLWAQNLPAYVPQGGLRLWYNFAGNALDASGNLLNGTTYNVLDTTDRFVTSHGAYYFSGVNTSYVIRLNPPGAALDAGRGSFTLSAWIKSSQTGIRTIVNKRRVPGTTNYEGYSLFLDNGRVKFHLCDSSYNNTLAQTNAAVYADGNWHHIVAVRDSIIDSVMIFVDGVLDSRFKDLTVNSISTSGDLYIGRWLNYDSYGFKGMIDDVGIWKRTLSQAEIQQLYNSCNTYFTVQPTDTFVNFNGTAVFNAYCQASPVQYQWQTDIGSGFQNLSDAGQYSGVNTPQLQVSNILPANENQPFRCISFSGVTCTDTSVVARIRIACNDSIMVQPANAYTTPGSVVQFSLTYTNPSANFQWQSNIGFGFQNLSNAGQFSGVNSDVLSVTGITMANHNQFFRCIVSQGNCIDTSAEVSIKVNTGLQHPESYLKIPFFPNPSKGTIFLNDYLIQEMQKVEVFDFQGRKLTTFIPVTSQSRKILISTIPGVYIIRIQYRNGEERNYKHQVN